jgi:hypothetical protein
MQVASMLEIQKYLKNGKTLDNLKEDLGIVSVIHPELPLVILNYNQIDSPKTNPIVREARALTLNLNWDLVSRSFNRFFNWGEVQDEMKLFIFNDSWASDKEDGSLVKLYNFQGNWYANTRGSFGTDTINGTPFTWQELFLKGLNVDSLSELKLDPNLTYITEFVSPYNKVVRKYNEPKFYLLTAFNGEHELSPDEVDNLVQNEMIRPKRYNFNNIDSVTRHIQQISDSDATYEGIVLCDNNFRRWKVKSPTYVALHAMWGNGNLFLPQYLLPFILKCESDELVTYYPEVKETLAIYKEKVNVAWEQLLAVWTENWQIEIQKDFALAIVKKTPFSAILFNLRKKCGKNQTPQLLKEEWRKSEDMILKVLF